MQTETEMFDPILHKSVKFYGDGDSWISTRVIRATCPAEALELFYGFVNWGRDYNGPGQAFRYDPVVVGWDSTRKGYIVRQYGGYDI